MEYKLTELLDIKKVQTMLDEFYQFTHIPHAIVDVYSNILIQAGWQDVCKCFHRRHPDMRSGCITSDGYIKNRLNEKEGYIIYKCKNGLMDAATPIIIDGKHMGSLFAGQVFFEPPDMDFFRQKAETYGFDVDAYLGAVARVPIVSQDKLEACIRCFKQVAEVIADMGLKNIKLKRTEELLRGTNENLEQLIDKRTMELIRSNKQLQYDLSQRKRIQQALWESEERLRTLINASPDVIYLKDGQGRFLEVNEAFHHLFGLEGISCSGKTYQELTVCNPFYKEMFERLGQVDKSVWESGEVLHREETIPWPNGTTKVYDVITIPVFNEDGTRKGLVDMGRDITERKKAQEQKRLLDEAREYDKLRTEFFANLSHEFRTPLNVILSALQLLNTNDIGTEKWTKYKHIMMQNCLRLLRLVNNLIDLTKIDADFFELHLENCNIVNIVEETTLSVAEYIESKELSLLFDTDVEEKFIVCDPDKIERIMLNLLSNAVKFSHPHGIITVNIYDKGDNIRISVKDDGIGIPQEKQKIIFERFRQVDKLFTREREGSGIGLSLVKSLVEMHGGRVSVVSECGIGSEFIIELPVKLLRDDVTNHKMKHTEIKHGFIERINIEFSDIYF